MSATHRRLDGFSRPLLLACLVIGAVLISAWVFRGEIAERIILGVIDRTARTGESRGGSAGRIARRPVRHGLTDGRPASQRAVHGNPRRLPTLHRRCGAGQRLFAQSHAAQSGSHPSSTAHTLSRRSHWGTGDLALQRWVAASATSPLPVHGPAGVGRVVEGINAAFAQDNNYRTAHHGERIAPSSGRGLVAREFELGAAQRTVLIDTPDLKVVAFAVDHGPVRPAVGYRFDYKGRTVVISGDTRASAAVEREARGVDLLVHEGLSPRLVALMQSGFARHARTAYAQVMADIRNYHTPPEEAAAIAQRAGVRMLVFNHIVPPLPTRLLDARFLGDATSRFNGPIRVGVDGDWFSMPAGSDSIEVGSRP